MSLFLLVSENISAEMLGLVFLVLGTFVKAMLIDGGCKFIFVYWIFFASISNYI